jgi:hypothetical protein
MINQVAIHFLRSIGLFIGVFSFIILVLWIYGWHMNAKYGTHYDLNALRDIYAYIITQINAYHGINSIWNSKKENMPGQG